MTYLSRRGDSGRWQVQIRVTDFCGAKRLLRFSLQTQCHREAKPRLVAHLSWLLLMQTPAEIDTHVDQIISQAETFVAAGVARDAFAANHRAHFLIAATKMLASWRDATPCPILYARFYGRQIDFAKVLSDLSSRVREDFEILEIPRPDPHYMKKPAPTFHYLCDADGVVEEIVQQDMGPYWPDIADELWPDGEGPMPDYDIGDVIAAPPAPSRREIDGATITAVSLSVADAVHVPKITRMLTDSTSGSALLAPAASIEIGADVPPMSRLLNLYLDELAQESDGKRTADRDLRPYIEFWIFIVGDKPIAEYTRTDARLFCEKVSDVPHPRGMKAQTPIDRYNYVLKHGWDGLKRLAETTIENRYFTAIRRIFAWAKEADFYVGQPPKLVVMGKKTMGALPKDAFSDAEVQKLFGQPKFTGQQRHSGREVGPFLVQDAIYWGYVILFLTGMRPGEIAQLEIDDIREFDGQILYFDLRPFDPEKGRVALEDMKTLKSLNASRLIPIHPALVELGLLDRARKLKDLGHKRLFPDWKWRVLPDGTIKHGDLLARDWQKRKAGVTTRANVSAYSGRHSMASLLDSLNVPPRDRERILGHSHPGVSGRYGRKGSLPEKIVTAFVETDASVVCWMREHLVAARDRAEADRKLIEDWAKRPDDGDR